jgi:hypothetical protein
MVPAAPEKPLADARRRLQALEFPPKPKKPKPVKIPKRMGRPPIINPHQVIGMKAAGISQTRIAEALDVYPQGISRALNSIPDSREQIAKLRESLKLTKMGHAHRIGDKMWQRLEVEVDSGGAKDVDALARSLLAIEKIEAGVSGEGAASGAPAPNTVDLQLMINTLLESPSPTL